MNAGIRQTSWIKLFSLVVSLGAVVPLHASQATLSLPLGGMYRAGRYMPVRVNTHTEMPDSIFPLRAPGMLPTDVRAANGRIDALVPWLCVGRPGSIEWHNGPPDGPASVIPLHALGDNELLVGYVGADPDILAPLFPDRKLVRVALDVSDPLAGEITAWEALDGVVLDATAAGHLPAAKVNALLAAGSTVAIQSRQKPGGDWPWKQHGPFWIAHVDIAGPLSAYNPDGYRPAEVWQAGWPLRLRRQVLGVAVIFTLLATAAALWRSRWTYLGVTGLAIIVSATIYTWHRRQSTSIETGGSIIVRTDATTQRDTWTYRGVLRESDGAFPWQTLTRPVFFSTRQVDAVTARLICSADGRPQSFQYHLKPRELLAFEDRALDATRQIIPSSSDPSPMQPMADKLYTRRRDRIVGATVPDAEEYFPSVVIDRGP